MQMCLLLNAHVLLRGNSLALSQGLYTCFSLCLDVLLQIAIHVTCSLTPVRFILQGEVSPNQPL